MSRPRLGRAEKDRRIKEGEERNAAWRLRSSAEQLADLDRRLGRGVGAKRQRAKLAKGQ